LPADSSITGVASADSGHAAGDSFFGLDKPKHFLISAFVESVAFNSLELAGVKRRPSIVLASFVTAGVGIAREMHDRRAKGLFSFGDLAWDAIGAATAGWMLRHTYK